MNPKVCEHCGQEITTKDAVGVRILRSISNAERRILYALTLGGTDKQVASILGLSRHTVRRHLTAVYDATGMSKRLETVMFAMRHPTLLAGCKAAAALDD